MRVRNYEKMNCLYLYTIILIILEICGLIVLCTLKTYSYKKTTGIVIGKNRVVLMINDEDKKILYKNQSAYIDNYCRKYKIIENRGKLFKSGKKDYYEIIIDIRFSNKYKINDVVELSLKNKKNKIINIFKIIWDGD